MHILSLAQSVLINAQMVKAWPKNPLVWLLCPCSAVLDIPESILAFWQQHAPGPVLIFFLPQDMESAVFHGLLTHQWRM